MQFKSISANFTYSLNKKNKCAFIFVWKKIHAYIGNRQYRYLYKTYYYVIPSRYYLFININIFNIYRKITYILIFAV